MKRLCLAWCLCAAFLAAAVGGEGAGQRGLPGAGDAPWAGPGAPLPPIAAAPDDDDDDDDWDDDWDDDDAWDDEEDDDDWDDEDDDDWDGDDEDDDDDGGDDCEDGNCPLRLVNWPPAPGPGAPASALGPEIRSHQSRNDLINKMLSCTSHPAKSFSKKNDFFLNFSPNSAFKVLE